MTATTAVPDYYHADVLEQYRRDTEHHEMEILLDKGLYRHVRFAQPGRLGWLHWHELITTPGQLTIRGDMGCFVFSRIEDMVEFFIRSGGHINPGYWAQKLVAVDPTGVRRYSEDRARERVKGVFDDVRPNLADPDAVWALLEQDVLTEDVIGGEHELRAALAQFPHIRFEDAWEWDLSEWSHQYLWCCHAIQQGITRYTAAKAESEVPA